MFNAASEPERPGLSDEVLRWVSSAVAPQATIRSYLRLKGATSSSLYKIQVAFGESSTSVVLRLFTNKEWLDQEPDLAEHEGAGLQKANEANLPTPRLIAVDANGDHCGVPAVLMSRLRGGVRLLPSDMDSWLWKMAEVLVRLHETDAADFGWRYFTYNDPAGLMPPPWSNYTNEWHRAIELTRTAPPESRKCFIHRDFHPTNLLWRKGRITGIVDWVNSCLGWPGLDVGHCRLNLAGLHGSEVADQFLSAYKDISGTRFSYDPYWDLLSAIEILPGPPSVYPGWHEFGARDLLDSQVRQRIDTYVASIAANL